MEEVNLMSQVTHLINNTGFPIAVCCALFWLNVKIIQPLSEVIAKNTTVLDMVLEKFGEGDG